MPSAGALLTALFWAAQCIHQAAHAEKNMSPFLEYFLLTFVAGYVLLTFILRGFPNHFANKVGQSVSKRGIPIDDIGYLNKKGEILYIARNICAVLFLGTVAIGAIVQCILQ